MFIELMELSQLYAMIIAKSFFLLLNKLTHSLADHCRELRNSRTLLYKKERYQNVNLSVGYLYAAVLCMAFLSYERLRQFLSKEMR